MRALAALDAVVFSSIWVGAVAVALMTAVSRALGAEPPFAMLVLGFGGTLVVYDVDRLRDLARDAATSPARSHFVARHRGALRALAGAGALASAAAAATLPVSVAALCAAVLAVGLLHRRIKRVPWLKTAYLTLAWVSVCAGIPALVAAAPTARAVALGFALGLVVAANVIVSNLRDGEGAAARAPRPVALGLALSLCGGSALLAGTGALGLPRAFAAIGLAEALAIAGVASRAAAHDPERWGLVVVDGALLVGGAVAALSA